MNYYIVLILIAIIFIYHLFILILRMNSSKRPIPDNLKDIYSKVEYEKWAKYHKKSVSLEIIESIIKFIALFILFAFKVYAKFASLFNGELANQVLGVVLLSFATDFIIGIGFDYYKVMVLDKEYGLSVTKIGTFIADEVKDLVIGFGLTYGLILFIGYMHKLLGDWMILVVFAFMLVFVLVISLIVPTLMKIKYRCDDLEEGELRTRLLDLLHDNGYEVRKIGVINQSKRSTTGNALFTGMGKFKTIILFDTIIDQLSTDELVAVFSHEVGHGKHKDTIKNYLTNSISILLLILVSWLLINYNSLYTDFGFETVNYGFTFIILSEVILEIASPIRGIIGNKISRIAEYNADNFACSLGYGEALASALKKLSNSNMADLNPHPLIVLLKYSHPTMSDRLKNIYSHVLIKQEEKND